MIDTDEIDNMKQWTNDYKVRMFWDLVAEVKRLRKAIADIATNMEAADASYMGGFIEDLWKVIE